jgi:hypothetical protein
MVNFSLIQHHKYSLTEIEDMIPWEKEIYVNLLLNHLEQEKLKMMEEEARRKSSARSNKYMKRARRR